MFERLSILTALFALALVLGSERNAYAQEGKARQPILVDEYGRTNDCDFGGRLDIFLAELSQKDVTYRGYIINYTGLDLLPGERQGFSRSREIANHITFRKFDTSRVTIIDGGLRAELGTELWILPPGVKPPKPSRIVSEPRLPKKQSYLFDRRYLALYETEGLEMVFLLPAARAEREEAERPADADEDEEANGVVEDVFELSEAEKDKIKFDWLSEPFGRSLASDKQLTGTIIFYADDEEYDISAVKRFIEEGVRRMEKSNSLKRGRIKAVFGGFRESMDVEYWIVPNGAGQPTASPEDRPEKQPDDVEGKV